MSEILNVESQIIQFGIIKEQLEFFLQLTYDSIRINAQMEKISLPVC
jgi:hypothetical protein